MDTITVNHGIEAGVRVSDLGTEAFNTFSNAPFEFENTACDLWGDTQKVYYHACTANRFSENYLTYCSQLEKNIKQLGSFCLTKAVLEQKGVELPRLKDLTILELVCMVSYHYRKAHAALDGVYRDNNVLAMSYLNWEFRWVGLGNRLKATEVKIQKIRAGILNADSMLRESLAFAGEGRTNAEISAPKSLQVNPAALPVKGSIARDMLNAEKQAQKQAEQVRKEQERKLLLADRLEREADRALGGFLPQPYPPAKEGVALVKLDYAQQLRDEARSCEKSEPQKQTVPPGTLTEEEARQKLLDDAKRRNDREAIRLIPQEDSDAIYARWLEYLERAREKAGRPGSGPPPDVRKALREKRKKKKK